ncbi:hypothetical protein OA667_02815 [Prochlorococcus sp. AH-716-G10]|nr:hypothetical protein [Prochlorococcus sp. AH-716-G10]
MKKIIHLGLLGGLLLIPFMPVKSQDNYFSLNGGFTLKKFERLCKEIKYEREFNTCKGIDVLFMMDKLSKYISVDKVREVTELITKTCSSIHENYKDGSIYPIAVNSCVAESINNLAKRAEYGIKRPVSWKGSELSFMKNGIYEICITEEYGSFPISNEKDKCRKYGPNWENIQSLKDLRILKK